MDLRATVASMPSLSRLSTHTVPCTRWQAKLKTDMKKQLSDRETVLADWEAQLQKRAQVVDTGEGELGERVRAVEQREKKLEGRASVSCRYLCS